MTPPSATVRPLRSPLPTTRTLTTLESVTHRQGCAGYNHATFDDLVLSGVVGLIPSANGSLVVNPLVPAEALPWWAADGMVLHGRVVSVLFDADGKKYGKGAGLKVWLDGKVVAQAETMRKLTVQL